MSKENSFKLNMSARLMLITAFVILIFSFISPIIFTQYSIIDFSNTGAIGDTLGGIMNPFIAIGAALLTYLAFYMQFKANQLQREQFEIQLEEDRNQFKQEFREQQEKFKKNQFENQFYEMLRLHKENVNEISINLQENYNNGNEFVKSEVKVNGRETFKYLIEEVKIIYYIAKKTYTNKDEDFLLKKAYGLFFHGNKFDKRLTSIKPDDKEYTEFINLTITINSWNATNNYKNLNDFVKKYTDFDRAKNLKYKIAQGHSAHLAHYYRHIFQTVKLVADQNEDFISYNEKRKYLRILRAQLSNQEQTMLFYNWKAGLGRNWENEINKYFTDYRMIHNIYNDSLIEDFSLMKIFNLLKPSYRKEANREIDPLFEFEDWNMPAGNIGYEQIAGN